MFTKAETEKMARESALDAVAEYIDFDRYTKAQGDEIVELAADYALDNMDAESDNGEWVDRTDYKGAARAAMASWESAQYDAMCDAGDHADHMARGC